MMIPENPDDWTAEHQKRAGAALARAHAMLEAAEKEGRRVTFGRALDWGIEKEGLQVPQSIQTAMLVTLAKVALNGFPTDVEA